MKKSKILCLILGALLAISLTSCGGILPASKNTQFELASQAFDEIEKAYNIAEQFGSDIYDAWMAGIYDSDELTDYGLTHLAKKVSLSESELLAGATALHNGENGTSTYTSYDIMHWMSIVDSSDDIPLFSYCTSIVSYAYKENGKANEARDALTEAKALMKEMSEKYSDYEHYPSLKGYYTTTNAYFEYCLSPTGSFEQAKTTINDYRNKAREYRNDLAYIFED